MKIIHHIPLPPDYPLRKDLSKLGFEFAANYTSIGVAECDERWPAVSRILEKHGHRCPKYSEFTQAEIRGARYLRLWGCWSYGYPQPEKDYEYRSITYDDRCACAKCCCGLVQQAPFRLRGEPKWGRKDLMQLHWVGDEVFVRPDVWERVFRDFGIECREVLSRGQKKLETVVQLAIPDQSLHHGLNGYPFVNCPACGRKKYASINHGFFPPMDGDCDLPIFRSADEFGCNLQVYRTVVISSALRAAIDIAKLKGVGFYPLAKT